jgi:hypothetical protein
MSRRLVLVLLMLVLPLQWSWAVAASVCAHEVEVQVSHPGHHAHEHQAGTASSDLGDTGSQPLGEHPDCGVCHSLGSAFFAEPASTARAWTGSAGFARYTAPVPERTVDALFRPPLCLVG